MKKYTYYRAVFTVGFNRTPAGRYYAEKTTKQGTERHCFSDARMYDYCDDENPSCDRSYARKHIASLFKG